MLLYCFLVPAVLGTAALYLAVPALSFWWLLPIAIGFFVAVNLLYVLFTILVAFTVDTSRECRKVSRFHLRHMLLFDDWLLTVCRVHGRVAGLEKIPKDQEFLLVCNHRSGFDPLCTWQMLRDYRLAFISKPENINKLIFGRCTHKCCFLTIDRENARHALRTINTAAELMRAHECSFVIYPEGTRSRTSEMLPFRNGAFKAAQKAHVPIVVTVIQGTEKVLRRIVRKRSDVTLTVLEVIDADTVKSMTTQEISERVRAEMEAQLRKLPAV